MSISFKEKYRDCPFIMASYDIAVEAAAVNELDGDELDYFISKQCRAYFFEKYLKVEKEAADQEIRSIEDSPIVPFELSPVQMKVLEAFEKRMSVGRKFRFRIMKCRRAKISTVWLAIGYHIVRFGENKKGLVFADRLETSRKLRRILDTFNFGDSLAFKPIAGKKTLGEGLYLHNSSVPKDVTERDSFILLGSAEQKNSGLGGSLDFFHWSEASLSADPQTHWTTISPSLQGALFDVAESTPSLSGQDEVIFPDFEHPQDSCERIFISWMDVDEYRIDDKEKETTFEPYDDHHLYGKEKEIIANFNPTIPQMLWRRFKLDELRNPHAFKQVFPISIEEAFYSNAGLFFHADIISACSAKEKIDVKRYSLSTQGGLGVAAMEDDTGSWGIYRKPFFGTNYVVTVDTAEGKVSDKDGRDPDYSVAMVFAMTRPIEEVAFFRERLPPEIFAEQLSAIGTYYRSALIIPERNNTGLACIVRLLQLYSNIYRQQKFHGGSFEMTQDYGFLTTSTQKPYALQCLTRLIREGDIGLLLHTEQALMEMRKFCKKGVKYEASAGYHDDCVSCLWLLGVIADQMPNLLTNATGEASLYGKSRLLKPDMTKLRPSFNYA